MRPLLAVVLCVLAAAASAEEPRGRASLAAVADGELDLVSDFGATLTFPRLSADVDARLSLRRGEDDFTFMVDDLQYAFALRAPLPRARGRAWIGAGQAGREGVDTAGQAWVQYVLAGLADDEGAFTWSGELGAVLDDREVDAQATVRGHAAVRVGRLDLFADLDALISRDDGFLSQWTVGPALSFAVDRARVASFFLALRTDDNPLRATSRLWLAGVTYRETPPGARPRARAPEIDGSAALGSGEGRTAGRLALRVLPPGAYRGWRATGRLDGRIVTARDTGDLFIRYDLGIEHAGDALVGAWFYHRSNHRLAEPGDAVTSFNVVESGIETPDWQRGPGRSGRFAGSLRLGYLVDGDFGEERRWHLRAGGRIALGRDAGSGPRPWISLEVERGEVRILEAAVGTSIGERVSLELRYVEDSLWFAADRELTLVGVRYDF